MKLRELKEKDAPLMLSWMHDPTVVQNLRGNFAQKTMEDCLQFIQASMDHSKNIHMAIVDDQDDYMGTVSLKNIQDGMGEFAITVRKEAMGKGYSKYGMAEILRYGIEQLGLKSVYWCVSPINERAVKFYTKNGYQRTDVHHLPARKYYSEEELNYYLWFEAK